MLSISRNVRLCVRVSVCLSVCSLLSYRLTVFLPPLPKVGCQIFLEIRNPHRSPVVCANRAPETSFLCFPLFVSVFILYFLLSKVIYILYYCVAFKFLSILSYLQFYLIYLVFHCCFLFCKFKYFLLVKFFE